MFDTDTSERRGVSSKKKKKQRQTEEFGQSDLSGVKFENPTWDSGEVEFENPASDVAFEEEGVQQPSQSAANPRLRTFDVSVDGTAQSSQESTARSDKSAEKFSSLLGKESAFEASETSYAKRADVPEEEREARLQAEIRAAGFKHEAENFRQAVFILLDEPESSPGAQGLSIVIMVLIFCSSAAYLIDTHPYVACTYTSPRAATCGRDKESFGDSTSKASCEASRFFDGTTWVLGIYTPPVPAVGMRDDCAAASTENTCEGEIYFPGFDPDGAAGFACVWNDGECGFELDKVDECSQWSSPFSYDHVAGDVETARQIRFYCRLIEVLAIIVFTIEYIARMATCTQRPRRNRSFLTYMVKPMLLIDLASILPFYVEIIAGGTSSLGVLRMVRLGRVFRVLRAGKVIKEMRIFASGYYRAREGLQLLFFLLFLYLCVFAALLYLVEYEHQTEHCFDAAGNYASICFADLGKERHSIAPGCELTMDGCDDNVDSVVVAFDRYIEGPSAPASWNGPESDCFSCAFTAFNCSDISGTNASGASWVITTVSPWDQITGKLQPGACAARVGATTGGDCAGGLPSCGGRITELPCDPANQAVAGGSSMAERPLRKDWFLNSDCRQCKELGCGLRAFSSIPTTWYFILATMTTVGYGDHYPRDPLGKFIAGLCMLVGILVLALPLMVIGYAFEETILEQERYEFERKQRIDIKFLERFGSGGDEIAAAQVKVQLDKLKADAAVTERRQKVDTEIAIHTVISLLQVCYRETGQKRFRIALEHIMRGVISRRGVQDLRVMEKPHAEPFE